MEPQYTPEWYNKRLGRFTSSEIHRLLSDPSSRSKRTEISDGAFTYIMEKVSERLTGLPAKQEIFTAAIDWGHAHELEALQSVANILDVEIQPGHFHPYGEDAGGTPDGLTEPICMEVKCPYNSAIHLENYLIQTQAEFKELRKEYYWQIVSNCLFTGRAEGLFISFDPRQPERLKLKMLTIIPPAEDLKKLEDKLKTSTEYLHKVMSTINAEVAV